MPQLKKKLPQKKKQKRKRMLICILTTGKLTGITLTEDKIGLGTAKDWSNHQLILKQLKVLVITQ